MRRLFRTTSARLLGASAGSAVLAAVLIVANPFPNSVSGQTVPGNTIPQTTSATPASASAHVAPVAQATGAAPFVPSPATAAVIAQQPVALPRTGAGLTGDSGFDDTVGFGLLALAAGLGSAAVVLRTRRTS